VEAPEQLPSLPPLNPALFGEKAGSAYSFSVFLVEHVKELHGSSVRCQAEISTVR